MVSITDRMSTYHYFTAVKECLTVAEPKRFFVNVPSGFDPDKHLSKLEEKVATQRGEGWSFVGMNEDGTRANFERPAESVDVERISVPLPPEFVLGKHRRSMEETVARERGDGWRMVGISSDGARAMFERDALVTQVSETEDKVVFNLAPADSKTTSGDALAARNEDQYEGLYLTKFEPHLRRAEMTRLTAGAVRTRQALKMALGCKPWDIQIATQPDGGYKLVLPHTYVPSRHDDKLLEVTETVAGHVGWRFEVDPKTLHARMIPGEPPLFPPMVPYPMDRLGAMGSLHKTLVGVTMPIEGTGFDKEVIINWRDSSFILGAGTPGSGKTVTINAIIAGQLSAGAELVIIDDRSKAVDFDWCKPYVRAGGWGCDSEKQAVAALAMVYEEGVRRAKILREMSINTWWDMPDDQRFPPITVIVDELTSLLVLDPVPKGVPKDNPFVIETNELNYMKQMIGKWINKIIAEHRFVGTRMLLSSQITNANTGLPPSTKGKIGHRFLQGTNPSGPQREQLFSDAKAVPQVPKHVQASGDNARGVGAIHLEGQSPVVYKSLFASVGQYLKAFEKLGLPKTDQPEPTAAQIAKHVPALDDDAIDAAETPSGKKLDPKFGPMETFDGDGNYLHGAAAAAAASKQISDAAAAEQKPKKAGPPCPACGLAINDGCEC